MPLPDQFWVDEPRPERPVVEIDPPVEDIDWKKVRHRAKTQGFAQTYGNGACSLQEALAGGYPPGKFAALLASPVGPVKSNFALTAMAGLVHDEVVFDIDPIMAHDDMIKALGLMLKQPEKP